MPSYTSPDPATRIAFDDLLADYFWALDTQDTARYVGVFWEDAVLEEMQLDGTVIASHGAEEIGRFAQEHFFSIVGHQHRDQNRLYLPDPEGNPDRWTVRAYWFTSHRENDGVEFLSTGHSTDVMERRNGEWRLARRWIQRWPGRVTHPLSEA